MLTALRVMLLLMMRWFLLRRRLRLLRLSLLRVMKVLLRKMWPVILRLRRKKLRKLSLLPVGIRCEAVFLRVTAMVFKVVLRLRGLCP